MASNSTDPPAADDDEYQVQYADDEEDDEQTIEEEERLSSNDEQNELDDLQADADMPLEDLLKMYSQNAAPAHGSAHDDSDASSEPVEYRHACHHLLQTNGQSSHGNDADTDDSDDSSFEPEIVKVINIGDEYQARVDTDVEVHSPNGHCDDSEVPFDELLWSPPSESQLDDTHLETYLKTVRDEYPSSDEEISLQTLLHSQLDTNLALVQFRQLPVKKIYSYSEWSLEETQQFEEGLREFSKNFFKIAGLQCPNRSVRDLVHHYYQWKKSERYEVFMEEQQRLNAITSVTDMIEKFIEEQEQQLCTATGVINPTNSSNFLSTDLKSQSPSSSISFVTIHQQETIKRSFDQVDQDDAPSAKKSAASTSNPSTTTTTS